MKIRLPEASVMDDFGGCRLIWEPDIAIQPWTWWNLGDVKQVDVQCELSIQLREQHTYKDRNTEIVHTHGLNQTFQNQCLDIWILDIQVQVYTTYYDDLSEIIHSLPTIPQCWLQDNGWPWFYHISSKNSRCWMILKLTLVLIFIITWFVFWPCFLQGNGEAWTRGVEVCLNMRFSWVCALQVHKIWRWMFCWSRQDL